MSLVLLAVSGKINAGQLLAALYLIPLVIVGTALSKIVHSRIGGKGMRIAVLVFALISGAYLIIR
jgi:uncharacterized membrane protein YfcA